MKIVFKKLGLLFVLIIVILSITGCVTRMLDFTVVSNKNVDMKIKDTAKGSRVTGEDHVWWILSIPLGTPSLEEAVDRAIESAGPGYDALMDGVIYSEFYFYLLAARSGYKVVGTPVKTAEIIARLEQQGEDDDIVLKGVLFHSSLERDNTKNIERVEAKFIFNGIDFSKQYWLTPRFAVRVLRWYYSLLR